MKFLVLALAIVAISARIPTQLIRAQTQALIQEGYQVDNVVNLLVALARVTGDNLQALIDNWAVTEANLLANVAAYTELSHAQDQHCASIDSTIDKLGTNIIKYTKLIHDAEKSITTNLESLATKREQRCAADLILLNKLKENKHATQLLSYLKARISDPSFKDYLASNAPALLELKTHVQNHRELAMIAIAKHHMLATLFQSRDIEDQLGDLNYDVYDRVDVGTGHVDNNSGELHLDHYLVDTSDLDVFIAQLVEFVEQLLSKLAQEKVDMQENAFKAADDLINYQDTLEHENYVLSSYIKLWGEHIVELQATLELNQAATAECHERANLLHDELDAAEQDLAERTDNYKTARRSLEQTLAQLEEVIRLYIEKVINAPAVYKAKIDEELARAHPVEPEAPAPESAEERAAAVEEFEENRQEELAAQEAAQEEARQEQRDAAAEERQLDAIEAEQEQREAERREEAQAQAEADLYVAPPTTEDLAHEESDVANQAASAVVNNGGTVTYDANGYFAGWEEEWPSYEEEEEDETVVEHEVEREISHFDNIVESVASELSEAQSIVESYEVLGGNTDWSEVYEEVEEEWKSESSEEEPAPHVVGGDTYWHLSGEESSEEVSEETEVSEPFVFSEDESESDDEWLVAHEEEEEESEESFSYHWSQLSGEESSFSEEILQAGGNGEEEQPEEEEPPIF